MIEFYDDLFGIAVSARLRANEALRGATLTREDTTQLQQILKTNPHDDVRDSALYAIMRNRLYECGDMVFDLFKVDKSDRVKQTALMTLVILRYKSCLPHLRQYIQCENTISDNQVSYVIFALGEFKCHDSVDQLASFVQHSRSEMLIATALKALGKIGTTFDDKRWITSFLKQYIEHPSVLVSYSAETSLELIRKS